MCNKVLQKAAVFLTAATILIPGLPVRAAENSKAYVRAQLTYESDVELPGLGDDLIMFADGWTKKDGWYYYKDPLTLGDKVIFMTAVNIPSTWTNEQANSHFNIIASVEASEIPMDGSTETPTALSNWKTLSVSVNEYQKDKNGIVSQYVNDKLVIPGDTVSKIVEFEIGGEYKDGTKPKPTPDDKDDPDLTPGPGGNDDPNPTPGSDGGNSGGGNGNTYGESSENNSGNNIKDTVQNMTEIIKTGESSTAVIVLGIAAGIAVGSGLLYLALKKKKDDNE